MTKHGLLVQVFPRRHLQYWFGDKETLQASVHDTFKSQHSRVARDPYRAGPSPPEVLECMRGNQVTSE